MRSHFSRIRFWSVVKKEFLQIKRDRASLAIASVMPLMMLLLFGYAVNTDVDHISTGVWDQASSKASRALIQKFENSTFYRFTHTAQGYEELQQWMDEGKIKVGMVIPPDYSHRLDRGEQARVQLIVDGADPNTAKTAVANAQLVVQDAALEIMERKQKEIEMPLASVSRVLYNPSMESRNFNIPALIGLILQNVTAILTAFALVRERERGTLEQLAVTPVKPTELILGKLVPYVCIGLGSFATVLITGIWWFDVPVKGNVLFLCVQGLLFLITTLAIGILISTVSKSQLQAMQISFAFILPSVLLSGFIFPRETMPVIIEWMGGAIPLTYFLVILRGIFLKGVGMEILWQETLILFTMTCLVCFLAITRFNKKLE